MCSIGRVELVLLMHTFLRSPKTAEVFFGSHHFSCMVKNEDESKRETFNSRLPLSNVLESTNCSVAIDFSGPLGTVEKSTARLLTWHCLHDKKSFQQFSDIHVASGRDPE